MRGRRKELRQPRFRANCRADRQRHQRGAVRRACRHRGFAVHSKPQFEDAIRRSGVGVERSLAAFAAGAADIATPVQPVASAPWQHPLAQRIEREFPPASHAILLAAVRRLIDYQDYRYASDYLDRLADFRHLDPELLRETARYLALWMSYEDAIRVADLKTRRARFERVHREAQVGPRRC